MKLPRILLTAAIVTLVGCETTPQMPPMAYTPEVRKMSYTDDILFKDSLKGVFLTDLNYAPNTKERSVVKIDVITPYDNRGIGFERWTIKRDGGENVAYIVKMIPDGHGGTDFNVWKDNGKALQGVPTIPPPRK